MATVGDKRKREASDGPASLGAPAPDAAAEAERKQREKRERAEAFRARWREQAEKKAREAANGGVAANTEARVPAAAPQATVKTAPVSGKGRPTPSTGPSAPFSTAGLRGVPAPQRTVARALATMDDTDDQLARRPIRRIDLSVEEEAPQPAAGGDDDDEDPLDAFMKGLNADVHRDDIGRQPARRRGEILDAEEEEEPGEWRGDDQADVVNTRAEDILAMAAKRLNKKDLPQVDHASIDYEPFRKDFYREPAELASMTVQDADRVRMELDAIAVRGREAPTPITKWSHCGMPVRCLDVIKELGFAAPTPIQSQAIPSIMSGRDLIGVAKTGSGKTLAFLLPMFRHIKDQRPVEPGEGPVGLVLAPTHELSVQIWRDAKPFLRALGLRAVCLYGGTPISEQIAEMKKNPEVVVATPGRMIDLLTANSGRVTNLRRITYLVLDEADRMFDMGFEPQVMKIVNNTRPDRQTVLFSATFPKPMESLARKVLHNRPLEITVGGRSVVAPEIRQIVEIHEEGDKFNRLLEILGQAYNAEEDTRTLIFVERQEAADELLRDLMLKGYPTMSLHGGKDQVDRDATISDFRNGVVPIVTATSVAARGLDVKQLKLVVNYDVPSHLEDYVHRAGRTGRAGHTGTCITFITPDQDRFAKDIVTALRSSKAEVPAELEQLAAGFRDKLNRGQAQAARSGFGGRGLERLEGDRERTMRAQQSAYGDSGEARELDNARSIANKEHNATEEVSEEQMAEFHVEVKQGAVPEALRENRQPGPVETSNTSQELRVNKEQLAAARAAGANTTKLQEAIARINAVTNSRREGANLADFTRRARDPDATAFHAVVPINDFPQKARWKVTNKETMAMLIESTGAAITNKGAFYEKGKDPQPGEPPKLSLLIESNEQFKVEQAVREIKRLLLEGTQAFLETDARQPAAGSRYTVV